MIHESKFLRIWEAPPDLVALIPKEKYVPLHQSYARSIEVEKRYNLDYVTATVCEWHTDWPEPFEYLVCRGEATLQVSTREHSDPYENNNLKDTSNGMEPPEFTALKIRRGMIIQLWPMCRHRIMTVGSIAMLSYFITPVGPYSPFNGFRPQAEIELYFKELIKTKYRKKPKYLQELEQVRLT